MRRMTARNNGSDTDKSDALTKEIADIKRLLVLLLLKGGASQSEVARALRCSQSTISEKFGFGEVETIVVRPEQ